MSITVINDHTSETIEEMKRKARLALSLIGERAEGYAKDDCPVDTGRLRNSIAYKVQEDDCYIGTNVEYAPYVEFNEYANHSSPPYGGGKAHFLRDAASTHGNEYKEIMQTTMQED